MIEFKNVAFAYGEAKVFENLNISIPDTGITAIIAPSGKGKTTLLRLLAGLIKPSSGEIKGVPEKKALVFQDNRLLPWETAFANIKCVCNNASEEEILAYLSELGITNDLAFKLPSELSGGQKQRVCLARAMLFNGDILLLDEPFTGLDAKNREIILEKIKEFSKNSPVILVSHSKDDIECANIVLKI